MARELEPISLEKAPQQERSRAAYERAVLATETLIRERGNDEFTLNDVAKRGAVSIGSIYNLFPGKEALIRVVHGRAMERMIERHVEMVAKAEAGVTSLGQLIPALVEEAAEMMRVEADFMRPLMMRAASDSVVAENGKRAYLDFADRLRDALLGHRGEITHPDPDRATGSAVRVIYAALARHLGYGSSPHAIGQSDWTVLKTDLSEMCAAYLTRPR